MARSLLLSEELFPTLSLFKIPAKMVRSILLLKTRNFPGDSLTTNSTSAIQSSTQQAYVRGRARQMVLRFESDDDAANNGNLGIGWRLGATRIDIRTDGRR